MPNPQVHAAPSNPTSEAIHILLAPGEPDGYALSHPYIDGLWLPILGPSAVALLRLVDRFSHTNPNVIVITLDELGQRIGVGGRGSTSRAARTIDRLCSFRVAARVDDHRLVVPLRLPALSSRQLDRLPPAIGVLDQELRQGRIQ